MVWLAIIALAIWVFVERQRVSELSRQLGELRRRAGAPHSQTRAAPGGVTPAMTAAARAAAEAAAATVATTPAPADSATPPPSIAPPAPAARVAAKPAVAPPPLARPTSPPSRGPLFTRAAVETWLAERGLAWIGGSALVVGAAFLVGYAAQQGFFTPPMRIIAAALLGLALLGAGEAIRRGRLAGFGGHQLAAAIASGAGAATLYGSAWAAYGLYSLIGGAPCAALLVVIALGLFALAVLHGEALAVLALAGAFAAPLLAGGKSWSIEALSLYLGILIGVGAVVGWLRSWSATAWTNLVGAAVWAGLAALQQDALKCLLIGVEPLAVSAGLAYLAPRAASRPIAAGVVAVASAAALVALCQAGPPTQTILIGLAAGLAPPFAVAALQRRSQVGGWWQAAPAGALVLAAMAARAQGDPTWTLTWLWCVQVVGLAAASLWAAHGETPQATDRVGALGALALALVAGSSAAAGPYAPLAPTTAFLALTLGAAWLARGPAQGDRQTIDIWAGAGAAAMFAAMSVALTWRWAAIAFAIVALMLAVLGRRVRWRSIPLAAAASAGLGFAALMTPGLLRYALSGGGGAAFLLGAGLFVAAASFVAARIVAFELPATQTLRTLSPLAALVGAFVFLRWLAGGQSGLPFDALTEASVRTFLMAGAGLTSLLRLDSSDSRFDRWRAHAELGAAALHGVIFQVLVFNPRFGFFGDLAGGVPLLNGLAVAYLAPAVIFGIAALRIYPSNLLAGRAYALVSGLFALVWAALEIRRFAHGPHLGGGFESMDAGEAVAGSLVLLLAVGVAGRVRPRPDDILAHPIWKDVAASVTFLRPAAVGFALVATGLWSNPCWGVAAAPLRGWLAMAAVLAGYGLIVPLTARLAYDALDAGRRRQSNLLLLAAMGFGLVLATLLVRVGFQGLDLRLARPTGEIETWSYSAVWAAIGLAFVGVSRAGGRIFLQAGLVLLLVTTAKVFIIDTASLSGVVRAGSFLALGVLLLLGALTARRIAQAAAPAVAAADAEPG